MHLTLKIYECWKNKRTHLHSTGSRPVRAPSVLKGKQTWHCFGVKFEAHCADRVTVWDGSQTDTASGHTREHDCSLIRE